MSICFLYCERIYMTKTEFLKSMIPVSQDLTSEEKALQQSGLQPNEPYYQGALQCIEQALKKKGSRDAVHFWEEYGFSLCKQLQHMETDTGRETVQTAVKIVKAILCAMKD